MKVDTLTLKALFADGAHPDGLGVQGDPPEHRLPQILAGPRGLDAAVGQVLRAAGAQDLA